MHQRAAQVLLVAMPYAGVNIPSIQLPLLASVLQQHGISVAEAHLYLQAASLYGASRYAGLIGPPNDSYTAQLGFTKYVFPGHWQQNISSIREYYDKNNESLKDTPMYLSFDEYVECTDKFYQTVISSIDWTPFDLIGFTLNYGQFLPSLAMAKHIKHQHPEKSIVFGGSRTTGNLGKHVLEAFEYVDFIVTGEGEQALTQLALQSDDFKDIPNLMYRSDKEIICNPVNDQVDLDTLPIPTFDQFYAQLQTCSPEVQQFFHYHGRLPVEVSRGCWWNQCSFCNLNLQYNKYREKSVKRIVQEILFLADRYKSVSFELIGNTLSKKQYRLLCTTLKALDKELFLFVEARAGHMNRKDYQLLREAGFTMIQTGIESFSAHYLNTMNKGAQVIDNIAVLKYCREQGIHNVYNLIYQYPNEEAIDFEQTKDTVNIIKAYLEPPNLCQLRVLYGSPMYCHPDQFNIKTLKPATIDELLFPPEILAHDISFIYDFEVHQKHPAYEWDELVTDWKNTRKEMMLEAVEQSSLLNHYVYYFVDGGSFIKIYDKRDNENIEICTLDPDERQVFLACLDVVSFDQLKQTLPELPDYQIAAILHLFEKNGIVYHEDNRYLALPLAVTDKQKAIDKECKTQSQDIVITQ